jgi:glycine/D-amino acid oxidase-like deaminating enzyme
VPSSDPQKPFWTIGLTPIRDDVIEAGETYDALVVGAGCAGLNAAIELATAGLKVGIVEAQTFGEGAASKAAGALANSLKARLGDIARLYGQDVAIAAYDEAVRARVFTEDMIAKHGIDCDLRNRERVLGAHSAKAFARLQRELPAIQREIPGARLLSREEFRSFVYAPSYVGGMLMPNGPTLNPASYQFGLARVAQQLGVKILQRASMVDFTEDAAGLSVSVESVGRIGATHLVLATNAESATFTRNALLRRLARRLMVMPSFAVISKPISEGHREKVIKGGRVFGDTCKILNWMAPTPSGDRLIYSARSGFLEGKSTKDKAQRIVDDYERRFPALQGVGMDYYWGGRLTLTGDFMPHTGSSGNVHWTLGCNGTGLTISSYLGYKVARRILRAENAATAFERPLPTMAAWRRNPVLRGAAIRAYRVYDHYMH